MEEELDAELLAVTEGQKRGGRARDDLSDGSASSGGQFDGVSDIDADDDDDVRMLDDEEDEDEEDDEFGLDDHEDDDYASKKKSTTRKKQSSRKPSKARAKPKRKSQSKKSRDSPSDDEEEFVYKYDKDGYGDEADRERVSKMNEFDRERLLADRLEERSKEYDLWKMKREVMSKSSRKSAGTAERKARSSGRSKASSKSDALQALAEDKRKKSAREVEEVSDADSEIESRPKRGREEKERPKKETPVVQSDSMSAHEGPELSYSDLVKVEKGGARRTTRLFLRRNNIVDLSQEPYFARVIVDLYTRIKVASGDHEDDSYLVCRIVGAETGKIYSLAPDIKTNWWLILQVGKQKRRFQIIQTSASAPSEHEFEIYRSRALDAGYALPRREEVDSLFKQTRVLFVEHKITPTEEENKKHIANMEILYPSRVNWTLKRTEARIAYDIKCQELKNVRGGGREEEVEKFKKEVDELRERLQEIESNERLYGVRSGVNSDGVFQTLARRNMMLNSSNEKLIAKRRNLEAAAGGIDPFARFDTTGQSYFSIKRKGEKAEEPKKHNVKVSEEDWRVCLKTWGQGKKRKFVGTAIDAAFAEAFEGLDDFQKDFDELNGVERHALSRVPLVDAVYADSIRQHVALPSDARITSFEEWYRMRMA